MSRRVPCVVLLISLLVACGVPPPGFEPQADEAEPQLIVSSIEQGLVSCAERTDTGYRNGNAFPITVVTADGKPVERDTANAYAVMQAAAAQDGVSLVVVSGFRTMAEQQYLYACYVNCNCNNCNLAAAPGTSNHQSGHALDLNTSAPGVLNWLNANGARFGFSRTVPSEAWHWEWWGGGPGGGPCGLTRDNCTTAEAEGCGNFGCGCVEHQCNGIFCPGTGCTAKETMDCAAFGCGCVDHRCNGGAACAGPGCTWREAHDCAQFGVNCADHQCSGGYGPNNGCTGKETTDCSASGCGCVDHVCAGGTCAGTGCTARQTLDCDLAGQGCALGACVPKPPAEPPDASSPGVVTPVVPPLVDAGAVMLTPSGPPAADEADPNVAPLTGVRGGCSSAPGVWLLGVLALGLRRRLSVPGR